MSTQEIVLLTFALHFSICIVSGFLAIKHRIGFWWGASLSFFLTPLFGIPLVLISRKVSEGDPLKETSSRNIRLGNILIILGVFIIIITLGKGGGLGIGLICVGYLTKEQELFY